jgi:hypothetical protein
MSLTMVGGPITQQLLRMLHYLPNTLNQSNRNTCPPHLHRRGSIRRHLVHILHQLPESLVIFRLRLRQVKSCQIPVKKGHNGRLGWWWFAGGLWYFYNGPVYPYPAYVSEDYADDEEDGAGYPGGPTWYYCSNPQGYYPYIKNCPGGWLTVVPNVTPPSPPPGSTPPPSGVYPPPATGEPGTGNISPLPTTGQITPKPNEKRCREWVPTGKYHNESRWNPQTQTMETVSVPDFGWQDIPCE